MFLAGPSQSTSNSNATRNSHGKRRINESFDFRAPKNIKTTDRTGQPTLDKFFSDPNTNGVDMEEVVDLESEENLDDTQTETRHHHNLTSNATNVPIHQSSWADMVQSDDSKKESQKCSPILIGDPGNHDHSAILKMIREKFDPDTYEWVQMHNNSPPRINCKGGAIKQNIMQLLVDNGIEYNTYGEKSNKKRAFIIRGMVNGKDSDNIGCIREAINDYNVGTIVSINRFLTPAMKRSENPNILYQLVLASDCDEGQLRQIKTIDNFRIKFEKMNQSKTIQCRRCQRFTHAAASCGFKYRCVQCTQPHGPGCCPQINNKKLPMGCINCLNANLPHTNHTANDIVNCGFLRK